MKKKKKKSFCNGLLCRKSDRIYKCNICGLWCCKLCNNSYKGKSYCIDCYVENFLVIDLKKEFYEMLKDIGIIKNEYVTKNKKKIIA